MQKQQLREQHHYSYTLNGDYLQHPRGGMSEPKHLCPSCFHVELFSNFMHSDVEDVDEFSFPQNLSAVFVIVVMSYFSIPTTLILHSKVFANPETPENGYSEQTCL